MMILHKEKYVDLQSNQDSCTNVYDAIFQSGPVVDEQTNYNHAATMAESICDLSQPGLI